MRNLFLLLPAYFLFTACGNTQKTASAANELVTEMSIPETVKKGSPVVLKFTVRNPSSRELKFCKWHTPFEPFMAHYLDITDANGTSAQYKGAMAKRIMPPPEEAYIKVPAGDSAVVEIDLLKGYDIATPGRYKVVYQSSGMSGLLKVNETFFNIAD